MSQIFNKIYATFKQESDLVINEIKRILVFYLSILLYCCPIKNNDLNLHRHLTSTDLSQLASDTLSQTLSIPALSGSSSCR